MFPSLLNFPWVSFFGRVSSSCQLFQCADLYCSKMSKCIINCDVFLLIIPQMLCSDWGLRKSPVRRQISTLHFYICLIPIISPASSFWARCHCWNLTKPSPSVSYVPIESRIIISTLVSLVPSFYFSITPSNETQCIICTQLEKYDEIYHINKNNSNIILSTKWNYDARIINLRIFSDKRIFQCDTIYEDKHI